MHQLPVAEPGDDVRGPRLLRGRSLHLVRRRLAQRRIGYDPGRRSNCAIPPRRAGAAPQGDGPEHARHGRSQPALLRRHSACAEIGSVFDPAGREDGEYRHMSSPAGRGDEAALLRRSRPTSRRGPSRSAAGRCAIGRCRPSRSCRGRAPADGAGVLDDEGDRPGYGGAGGCRTADRPAPSPPEHRDRRDAVVGVVGPRAAGEKLGRVPTFPEVGTRLFAADPRRSALRDRWPSRLGLHASAAVAAVVRGQL